MINLDFVYSENINIFLTRIKKYCREIISGETDLLIRRNRIEYNHYLYPFYIVVFESDTKIGFFDHNTYQIGINKKLIHSAKTSVIKNILRHEIAHMFSFIIHGNTEKAHGIEFKNICTQFNWGVDVYSAKINIEMANNQIEGELHSEKIINKTKKLLALSSSSNHHEAEIAMIKANQLIMNHNLHNINSIQDDNITYLKRVITGKKVCGKHKAIYEILRSFWVQPVFSHGKGIFFLEVIGSKVNVDIADYIAKFLDRELENMWTDATKKHSNLRGINKKNSFMLGITSGFKNKIDENVMTQVSTSLIKSLKYNVEKHVSMVYPKVSHSSSKSSTCNFSKKLGEESGKNLCINPAISSKSNNKINLLL